MTFTATVTATGGNPSGVGSVTFKDGPSTICAAVSLTGNTAQCATSTLSVGGSPHSITAVYSGATGFNTSTSSALSQVVNKAASTTVVTCPASVTYTGSALTPCTVSVTGAGGLSLTPTPTYAANTNVGTATASYAYAGDANHNASSESETFAISKAASTTVVTCPASVTYTGSALTPCTVSVTGAGGLSLTPTPTYAANTNVGTATASYAYAGDANHNASSDSETFAITPKSVTITPTSGQSKLFGSADPALTFTNDGGLGAGDVTGALARAAGEGVGTYAIGLGTLSAGTNYALSLSATPVTFAIDQAGSTTVVTFEVGPYVYRGTEFIATAVVTGAGGLNQSVAVVLSGDCTNVTSTDGCTATATFAGDTDHTGSSDIESITITKATAVIDVTP